jgi:aldose 1-epimerase
MGGLRFEQTADDASIAIDASDGCRLASLQVFGSELLVTAGEGPIRWGCYPMAPWVGRTRRGWFSFAGSDYQLPINLGPHAIHGTVFNQPWRPLDPPFTFEIDTGPHWPFPGVVRQEVRLGEGRLDLRLEVHSVEGPMPAACGWHPWFRRQVGASTAHESVTVGHILPRDADGISGREPGPVPPPPWDDCFGDVTWPATITWPGLVRLGIESDQPFVVVYNEEPEAFCIEPQSAPPDSLNHDPFVAEPGQPLVATAGITWQPA